MRKMWAVWHQNSMYCRQSEHFGRRYNMAYTRNTRSWHVICWLHVLYDPSTPFFVYLALKLNPVTEKLIWEWKWKRHHPFDIALHNPLEAAIRGTTAINDKSYLHFCRHYSCDNVSFRIHRMPRLSPLNILCHLLTSKIPTALAKDLYTSI